jgi:general secretion pathway protein G
MVFWEDTDMAKRQKNKGVTLIELLIVVLILAALAAIAIPRISQGATNAKARVCETNINILNQAIEEYYSTNGAYPATLSVISINTSLFPDGQPTCPIINNRYPNTLGANNRVDASAHSH